MNVIIFSYEILTDVNMNSVNVWISCGFVSLCLCVGKHMCVMARKRLCYLNHQVYGVTMNTVNVYISLGSLRIICQLVSMCALWHARDSVISIIKFTM